MKATKERITTWDKPNHQVKDVQTGKKSDRTFGQLIQEICDDFDEKKVKYVIEPHPDKDGQIALFAWNKEPADYDKIKSVKATRNTCPHCGISGDYVYVGVYSEYKECCHCLGYRWRDDV